VGPPEPLDKLIDVAVDLAQGRYRRRKIDIIDMPISDAILPATEALGQKRPDIADAALDGERP
jgi:hypothetical protein